MTLNLILFGASQIRTDILDGSTRIMLECLKRWKTDGHRIRVVTCEEGYEIYRRGGLSDLTYTIVHTPKIGHFAPYFQYVLRTLKLSLKMLKFDVPESKLLIFSGSDFLPDFIPALLLKARIKRAKWVVAFYLSAPNPFSHRFRYKGRQLLRGLSYFLMQLPTSRLARKYADMVWVTSESDRLKFARLNKNGCDNVFVVRWGVDNENSQLVPNFSEKDFDAVFVGRLHPQKGVMELLDIWTYVVSMKHDARLAIVGTGELEESLLQKLADLRLSDHVVLLGFQDGIDRIRILRRSRIFVHPAIHDTGAIAPMEAMACGLPVVCFDLPELRTYYPRGVLRAPPGNLRAFAEAVARVLRDEELHKSLRNQALQLAQASDWNTRSRELSDVLESLVAR